MKFLGNVDIDTLKTDVYEMALKEDLKTIKRYLKQGYTIQWSCNENFLTIKGKTFNIRKSLFEELKKDGKIDEEN